MLKIKIMASNDIQEYSQFYDFEEFKTNIEIWLIDHQQNFTRGEMYGLNQLIQLSSRVPGVCFEAMRTIVCCPDKGLGEPAFSLSTFKRVVYKCIRLGMLKVYETEDKDGAQGGNLYVFNPYPGWDAGTGSSTHTISKVGQ
ncbi:hypothetical protein [Fredinandcohnia onubensis]|uniref:hypothetical protein n=1 Tax=Fredinandcohnia onubensis TaxID=1571209 RepID=UPI000C0C0120|nr:hypothetical protein [Fredinandcohnia onubensis]